MRLLTGRRWRGNGGGTGGRTTGGRTTGGTAIISGAGRRAEGTGTIRTRTTALGAALEVAAGAALGTALGTALEVSARTTLRAAFRRRGGDFLAGEFSVGVFVEREQCLGGIGDLIGGDFAIGIGVEGLDDGEGHGADHGCTVAGAISALGPAVRGAAGAAGLRLTLRGRAALGRLGVLSHEDQSGQAEHGGDERKCHLFHRSVFWCLECVGRVRH